MLEPEVPPVVVVAPSPSPTSSLNQVSEGSKNTASADRLDVSVSGLRGEMAIKLNVRGLKIV